MQSEKQKLKLNPEKLAYWYFRLNGFLTTVNFVVHPDQKGGQRTDADILGVRFPHRSELLQNPMPDEDIFTRIKTKPYIVIAEVKTGKCRLNGPWTEPERENMQRVLRAIGLFPTAQVGEVAQRVYDVGVWEDEAYFLSLACVGETKSRQVESKYPDVPQITWDDILGFVFDRFKDYKRQKSHHQQWPTVGKILFKLFKKDESEQLNIIYINIIYKVFFQLQGHWRVKKMASFQLPRTADMCAQMYIAKALSL